jgi:hypothetical protein
LALEDIFNLEILMLYLSKLVLAKDSLSMMRIETLEKEYTIPHPYSLMAIKLKELGTGKFKVVASRMYAMSAPLFSDTAQLYRFPYGNVYSDGRICWGGYQGDVDRKRYNNILQSGELVDLVSKYWI